MPKKYQRKTHQYGQKKIYLFRHPKSALFLLFQSEILNEVTFFFKKKRSREKNMIQQLHAYINNYILFKNKFRGINMIQELLIKFKLPSHVF